MIHNGPIWKLDLSTDTKFKEFAVEVYRFQRQHNNIYAKWCDLLGYPDQDIQNIEELCFLPIALFKNHRISCFKEHDIIFTSSSTSGLGESKHYMYHAKDYINTFTEGFKRFFGSPSFDYLAALLPSYLDRQGSGLIYMVHHLMQHTIGSGDFYNREYARLIEDLARLSNQKKRVALFSVTFGLIELMEYSNSINWEHITVIETGGMKGHGKEIVRQELYQELIQKFPGVTIGSEYGMTELTSQAYANQNGLFQTPPWMRIVIQDPADPKNWLEMGKTGRICIVDLMNYHSCAFLATDDLGRLHADGSFEVLGRLDYADIRGCNQLL